MGSTVTRTGATQLLAEMVVGLSPVAMPEGTTDLMVKCILDWIGVTAGGARLSESSSAVLAALSGDANRGDSTVLGSGESYPELASAFLNGTFAHSLELDDTYSPGRMHAGAPCVAAGLAVGKARASAGPDFLAALLAGYEVSYRLSGALGQGMFSRGLHPTGVAGTFGATATVARLMNFSEEQLISAFGLAASMASGSTQYLHSGSWNKRLHAGLAARNGILAANLAGAGVIGATESLEGEHGVLHAFSDHSEPDRLTAELSTTWTALEAAMKPYPGCRLTHGSIDAALRLRRELSESVPAGAVFTVRINPDDAQIIGGTARNKFQPRNTVEGQFSVYFQVAAALLHGSPDWTVYELIGDRDVEGLCRRIFAVSDDDVPESGAILSVSGAGLHVDPIRVDHPTGDPATALSWDVVETKFRSLADTVFDDQSLDRIVAAVRRLPTTVDVPELARVLRSRDSTTITPGTEHTA